MNHQTSKDDRTTEAIDEAIRDYEANMTLEDKEALQSYEQS